MTEKHLERVVITVRPVGSADDLLRIEDAFRQVLDLLSVAEQAKDSLAQRGRDFEWRLESATTNSPFKIVALACALNSSVDVSEHAARVKLMTEGVIVGLARGEPPPPWIDAGSSAALKDFFSRTRDRRAITSLDFLTERGAIEVDAGSATSALPLLERPDEIAREDIPARVSLGEVSGRMVSVGRYYTKPALQIHTPLYGPIWCVLTGDLVEQFGGESRLEDVWRGKRIDAYGRLYFAPGGRLARVEAQTIKEREVPRVPLEAVLDPDFTSGLEPVEYLKRLHGE